MAKKSNARTVIAHLRRYADYLENSDNVDKEGRQYAAQMFNQMIDDMDDFFGTEGQCDPRGDQRND